jgi:microcystin-dependent protein
MSDPFIGEIRMFAGDFAPRGWALCDGQLLAISQNDTLFSLLGTTYGGDGRTTFALPDLRGRLPVHMGSGPGRRIGSKYGSESTTLAPSNVPAHTHQALVSTAAGTQANPGDGFLAASPSVQIYRPEEGTGAMDARTVAASGNATPAPRPNIMPFLCVNFIIALIGVYPSRS